MLLFNAAVQRCSPVLLSSAVVQCSYLPAAVVAQHDHMLVSSVIGGR
jgi:hypothetical protein